MSMSISSIILRIAFIFLCLAGSIFAQGIQTPSKSIPLTQKKENILVSQKIQVSSKMLAASKALETGLPGLAQDLYEEILTSGIPLSQSDHDFVVIDLSTALISQHQYARARSVLKTAYDHNSVAYKLRWAMLELVNKDLGQMEYWLSNLDSEKLSISDRFWYYLIQGMASELKQNSKEANQYLKQALDLSVSKAQKAEVEALIYRNQILSAQVSESLVPMLLQRLNSTRSSKTYVKYALEYAIVLDHLEQTNEAIDFLKTQIQDRSRLGKEELMQYWMTIAVLTKGEGELPQKALQFLIKNDASIQDQRIILYLLARSSGKNKNLSAFRQYLDVLTTDAKSKPLLGDLLILRATVSLELKEYEAAQNDAMRLLQEFPGESLLDNQATGFLAYIALSRQPPQYRIAANYISSLESQTQDPILKVELLVVAADCYFLNEDYTNAASLYDSVLKMDKFDSPEKRGIIFYQLVLSEIKAGRLSEAEALSQNIDYLNKIDTEHYWKSQWNLVYAEKQNNHLPMAHEYIKQILSEPRNQMPEDLKLRFIWLDAQLALDLKKYVETQRLCQQIVTAVLESQSTNLELEFKKEILAYTYYIEGQSYLAEGSIEEALRVFNILRQDYPNFPPSILSYLAEARYYSSKGRTVEAQQRLVELADKYVHDENVPIALYEGAIQADSRGVVSSYKEAIGLLERLCTNFPESSLVFSARLKQGDILRKMNDFASAQLVYENLLNSYKDNPNRPLAMMGRAECLLAEGGANPIRYEEAAIAFERIFDMAQVPVDLRIEAGYKWAYASEMQQNITQAQRIYWQNISHFLLDPIYANQFEATGRYWMSKTIFSLGSLLEKNNSSSADVRAVYRLIITHNLPGQAIAKTKL